MPEAPALHRFEDIDFDADWMEEGIGIAPRKAYFVGCNGKHYHGATESALPVFEWDEFESDELKQTPLHGVHRELGAKMAPFAGYDMPLWYDSVAAEHRAVRTSAGIFDVTHMGVFEFSGTGAEVFLNAVTTNDVTTLAVGDAHYSYLLGIDGIPLDDIYVYRRDTDRFMVVVNASNNDKNWEWLNAVKNGDVQIDRERPWVAAPGREQVELRDLRADSSGADRRVDIALQGPGSKELLTGLGGNPEAIASVKLLAWSTICQVNLGGFDLIVSRTGYTGERIAYELFVHPDNAATLFKKLVESGATPCGLAARDSLRVEAGLPLYGHELEGHLNMNPGDAGFAAYVKTWKPFFIGKHTFMEYESGRDVDLVRFQIDSKGLRSPTPGDPIIDNRGRVIGQITSSALDTDGAQVGLALVKAKYAAEGTPFMIYAQVNGSKPEKTLQEVEIGDKVIAPQAATVLSRFPKRKRK